MKNKIWTEEELTLLKTNYPNFGAKYCAEEWAKKEIEKSKDLLNEQTKNRIIYEILQNK